MNTKQRIKDRREQQERRKRWTILMIVVGAALIVSAGLLLLSNTGETALAESDIVQPDFEQPPLVDGSAAGDPEAPVVIVDYSDFGCSHCGDFALSTGKQLMAEYVASGEVYFEYKSVGGLLGSSATAQAAEAAYCAGDQEAFFPFHDLIYANQATLFVDRNADISASLVTFAELLGLDTGEFSSCLESGKYQSRVAQDEADARAAGVTGTPSFLVNGKLLRGNQPFANFQQIIEAELESAGK